MPNREERPHDSRPLDDDIDELRALWTKATPHTGLGEELEREDALTRASVSLLQEAWNSVVVPAPLASRALVPPSPAPTNPDGLAPRQWLALAAAAVLLFAVALGLRSSSKTLRDHGSDLAKRTIDTDALSAANGQYAENGADSKNRETDLFGDPSPRSTGRDIRVEVTDDERLVLKSGPVRLYLAANSAPSNSSITNSFDTQATEISR